MINLLRWMKIWKFLRKIVKLNYPLCPSGRCWLTFIHDWVRMVDGCVEGMSVVTGVSVLKGCRRLPVSLPIYIPSPFNIHGRELFSHIFANAKDWERVFVWWRTNLFRHDRIWLRTSSETSSWNNRRRLRFRKRLVNLYLYPTMVSEHHKLFPVMTGRGKEKKNRMDFVGFLLPEEEEDGGQTSLPTPLF